jgi:hypothetical protein
MSRYKALAHLRSSLLLLGCLACSPVRAEEATGVLALDGQCALGWVFGHRILTDCKISWRDPRKDRTYCFTTPTARERFLEAAEANADKAEAHFLSAAHSSAP